MYTHDDLSHLPALGLQFEANAEKLMQGQRRGGVVFLLIGGILALRRGAHALAGRALAGRPTCFYLMLTAHGIDMLIFWIIFFEIAVLYFCSSTLLRCRLATPQLALARLRADGDRRDHRPTSPSSRAARA